MTNEMKLLTALCDALGFDVEKSIINLKELDDYQVSLNERLMAPISTVYYMDLKHVKPIYEYKLTMREPKRGKDIFIGKYIWREEETKEG